jgi:hypothetical protein
MCDSSVSGSAVTAYCAEGRTVISARTFHIARLVWVKFRVTWLHVMLLDVGEFRENRGTEGGASSTCACALTFTCVPRNRMIR